jgi:hypothetical protein
MGNNKWDYEAAFLTDDLYNDFADIVGSCATLKAWFAFRISIQEARDGLSRQSCLLEIQVKPPDWDDVWAMIQDKRALWSAQYKRSGPGTNRWEFQEPVSALELFASALLALSYEITANSVAQRASSRGFRWHQDYYEDKGRTYLLYQFVLYLNVLISPNQSKSIHKPIDLDTQYMPAWLGSWGGRMHQASTGFMNGEQT